MYMYVGRSDRSQYPLGEFYYRPTCAFKGMFQCTAHSRWALIGGCTRNSRMHCDAYSEPNKMFETVTKLFILSP